MDKYANLAPETKQKHFDRLRAYREKLREHPVLEQLFLEVTDRCNEHCRHCGSSCEYGGKEREVSDYDLLKVLVRLRRQLKNDGQELPFIVVTGGEPLLREGVIELAASIRDAGYRWGMTSNGTLINHEVAEKLKEAGMSTISISLDGTKEVHNWFRQDDTAYERTLRGIEALVKTGFKDVMVTTCVHQKNLEHLEEIRAVVEGLGASTWRLTTVDPIGRAGDSGVMLAGEQYRQMLDYVVKVREEGHTRVMTGCNYYLGLEYEHKVRPWYFECMAGVTVASIQCGGGIGACLDIERRPELIYGKIPEDDFYSVWKNRFEHYREDRTVKSRLCSECIAKDNCGGGGCHTWDWENNEPRECLFRLLQI